MNEKFRYIGDTSTMIKRCLKHATRHVEVIILSAIMPLMQLLVMAFIFSEAMQIEGFSFSYLDYVLPGLLLMSLASSASMSASSIKEDMIKGIIDRFRSMDIGKSALLNGHMIATLLRCALTASIILIVAICIGFQVDIPFINYVLLFMIIFMFTIMYTWLSIAWGLFVPSLEAVGALTYLGMFLPYISSCMVPIENLPDAIKGFAKFQPFTPLADSIRGLLLNFDTGNAIYIALAWCIGLAVLFYIISLRLYNKQAK